MSARTLSTLVVAVALCAVLAPAAVGRTDETSRSGSISAATCATGRSLAGVSRAAASRTFDDFIQDTRGPDICGQNAVGNDNEGWITFGMHIHNRNGFMPNEVYAVLLDTDLNPATGLDGADQRLRVTADAVQLGKWDGTSFVPQSTLAPAVWQQGYGPVFRVNASELGGVQSFGFFLAASDGVNADVAPNRGAWSYQLSPLELTAGRLLLSRARPGAWFTAQLAVRRGDLDAPLAEGTIACAARLGTKTLRGSGRFVPGGAGCAWRLPKRTRGKRLTGSITVSFQGVEAKRSFSVTIR